MPHSLRSRIKKFHHQGLLSDKDRDRILNALDYEWIPIAEPIPDTEVLCCNQRGDILIGYLFEDKESNTGYSAESEQCYLMDCVAWMPLPKPYKEEK